MKAEDLRNQITILKTQFQEVINQLEIRLALLEEAEKLGERHENSSRKTKSRRRQKKARKK